MNCDYGKTLSSILFYCAFLEKNLYPRHVFLQWGTILIHVFFTLVNIYLFFVQHIYTCGRLRLYIYFFTILVGVNLMSEATCLISTVYFLVRLLRDLAKVLLYPGVLLFRFSREGPREKVSFNESFLPWSPFR